MPRYFSILSLFLLPFLCISCATIMNGPNQPVGFSTTPTDAEIWINNRFAGRSPTIVKMKRNEDHIVQIRLDGYLPYDLTFTRTISGWVAGNIVFGGPVGVVVDAITGGIYQLTPDQVQVEMRKGTKTACNKKSDDSFIAIILEADPSWEKIGNLIACN